MAIDLTMSSVQVPHARKQPAGLAVLFFAELWERFSFYGLRALLIFYMTKELLFKDPTAYSIYGTYGALVWASPIIGGYLADRYLGNRMAIYIGGFIIALGHLLLTLPFKEQAMFYGLACLVIGTAFFKPNISSLLGQLYEKHDPRRDSGFTIFYMGINLGGFLAPFACGYLGETYGWHYGFGLAALGMFLGLFIFWQGQHVLQGAGLPPKQYRQGKEAKSFTLNLTIILATLLAIPVVAYFLNNNDGIQTVLPIFTLLTYIGVIIYATRCDQEKRNRILTVLLMIPFVAGYFACLEQCGSALNLFTERNVDRVIFGYEAPATYSQAINPAFIILLGFFFTKLWAKLGASGQKKPSAMIMFGIGMFITALGFYALILGIKMASPEGIVSLGWLILCYFLLTAGELIIYPIALSAVTKISPTQLVSFMMGALMLSQSLSHLIAAGIPKFFSMNSTQDLSANKLASLSVFEQSFNFTFYFALGFVVLAFLLLPLTRKKFAKYDQA